MSNQLTPGQLDSHAGLANKLVTASEFRLLIVEDDPVTVLWIREYLPCFVCEHVTSMAEAVKRLALPPKVNVLLLDLNLPDSKGTDTVSRITELFPDVPVVAMTAYGNNTPKQIISAGADNLIFKGYVSAVGTRERLIEAMARHESNRCFAKVEQHMEEMKKDVTESREKALTVVESGPFRAKRDSDVAR